MRKIRLVREDKREYEGNEGLMKEKGEERIFKSIVKKNNDFKEISSTQKGQQLLLDESIRILPSVKDWMIDKVSTMLREDFKSYFLKDISIDDIENGIEEDDFLLQKILETFFYMAGSIYMESSKKGIKARHKKIASINKHVLEGLDFSNTWRFVEVVIHFSKYFQTESCMDFGKGLFLSKDVKRSVSYTTNLSEVILEEVTNKASVSFYPLPMNVAPKDWAYSDGIINGGYETYQYELIRSHSKYSDYDKLGEPIFDSINYIQSVPWRVNEVVLNQLKKDLAIPLKEDFIKSTYPNSDDCRWDVVLAYNKEKREIDLSKSLDDNNISLSEFNKIILAREVYKNQTQLYNAEARDYDSAVGKYRYAKLAISIAEKYLDQKIYFPHNFDSRGRIYPIPIGLSPQGSDAIKALLLYDNREGLTKHGLRWSYAYLASLYGDDKLDFDDRVNRGKALIDCNYLDADEPYQFLSHQIELKKYLLDNSYKPSLRIHLDACNSGSQFTSAITGDIKGCKATNVIPTINEDGSQDRQDAYILVSNKSISKCSEMLSGKSEEENYDKLTFFRNLLLDKGRKICKEPAMVSNYGGTAGGRATALWDMLRELKVDRQWITKKNANLFGKIIGDSIVGVLTGGKAFELYIQKMNNLIAKDNKAVIWTTSDGFYVIHSKNSELKPKNIRCKLPGSRSVSSIKKKQYSSDLSKNKMKSAISPNYIHSLDAELLRRVALRMKYLGITDTDWIHDSFGCHPNHVEKLLEVTKEEFLKLIQNDPLGVLDKQLRGQLSKDETTLKNAEKVIVPKLGSKDEIKNILKVLLSNWFFS